MNWESEILFAFAPVMKAAADTVDHHFDISIFKRKNREFWDRDVSQTKALKIFSYKADAWHLSLSAMVVLFILAIIFHQPKTHWYIEFVIAGAFLNLCFNLFYKRILI